MQYLGNEYTKEVVLFEPYTNVIGKHCCEDMVLSKNFNYILFRGSYGSGRRDIFYFMILFKLIFIYLIDIT